MRTTTIDSLDQFDRVRAVWDRTYRLDPQAHVFMSSSWVRGCLASRPTGWQILQVSIADRSEPVGFCAVHWRESSNGRRGALEVGASPLGDYTGFVCLPDTAADAVAAIADHLRSDHRWHELRVRDMMDDRLDGFVSSFRGVRHAIHHARPLACPCIKLPSTWEDYLQGQLSSGRRESLRRQIRKIQELPGFGVSHVTPERLDQDVDVLLALWSERWGTRAEEEVDALRRAFRHCLDAGEFWLDILWTHDTPVVAMAGLWDQQRKTFAYYMSGFNSHYQALSPGRVMVAHSIKAAIEGGMAVYDFLRGDEPYKYEFGARDRFSRTVVITRRNVRSVIKGVGGKVRSLFGSHA